MSARFPNRCHFLPQSWFVFDAAGRCTCRYVRRGAPNHPSRHRCDVDLNCAQVLRFERLEDDFDGLMRSQKLPMRLAQARKITHHVPSNLTRAAVADAATIKAVRGAYPDDFALLPAVNGTCADLANYSEPYDLTDKSHVCMNGKLE